MRGAVGSQPRPPVPDEMVAEEAQGGHEADTRRSDLRGLCRGHGEGPQQVMGNEQAIDLLEDADRTLAAERTRRALMRLELVPDEVDLPALVVGEDEFASGRHSGVQQRGDQAMLDLVAGPPCIVESIVN